MTNDFSPYTAGIITDWFSQGTDMPTAPSDLYVAVFDDTDTERSTDFFNDRVQVPTGTDWTRTNTAFENTNDVSFGEAGVDVNNLQDIALYDAASGGNELARYEMTDALFDVSAGTTLVFEAGEISFDVLD